MTHGNRKIRKGNKSRKSPIFLFPLSLFLCSSLGCAWDYFNIFSPPAPPGALDNLVLHGDTLEAESASSSEAAKDMAGARELFRQGNYSKAEKIFHRVSDNKKNPVQLIEEAIYYEGECLRLEHDYPRAADTYAKLFTGDFPAAVYREPALQHMFEIADYWLEDTRVEMEAEREKKEGKRWFVMPAVFHWADEKPVIDEEGRALEKLEQVRINDMTGPLADKALFLAGSVKFYREDYKEADYNFSQLVEMHPNSPLASRAVELGIICKHMSTGGPEYDTRKCAEARQLVHAALRSYPDLASQKSEFLQRQLVGINLQQAEKDFKIAEFYRRTGHPGSAYFYYEIVRRRYPGTRFFDLATDHMNELRAKLEKEQGTAVPEPSAAAQRPETPPAPRRVAPGAPNFLPPVPDGPSIPAPDEIAPKPRKVGT